MSCYAFIFARSGSTRLKNKNLKKINGKPLITHSILAAKKNLRVLEYDLPKKNHYLSATFMQKTFLLQ